MNKKMLFVVNNFNIGGPQKSLLSLLYYFPKDIEIDIIVLNKEMKLERYLPENVKVINISDEIPLLMLNKKGIIKNIFLNVFKNPKLSFETCKFLSRNIFSSNFVKKKQKFWIENREKVKKVSTKKYDYAIGVSGGHSIMYVLDFINAKQKVGWIRTEYQNLNRNLHIDYSYFKKLNLILSVSKKCTEKFIEIFPDQKVKIHTFYNPLPYKMYEELFPKLDVINNSTGEERISISTISRLDKDKGFDMLVQAATLLKRNKYNFIWNIYGVGSQKKEILKGIKKNRLEKYVQLKGFEFNTGKVLKETDILVHPSRYEGKSNTIDEAKFYGIPIVATNFPTVSEQLTNNIDSIITDMDGESLHIGIKKIIDNPLLRAKFKATLINNRNHTNNYFEQFLEILRKGGLND